MRSTELIINGKDAYEKWGVCMGEGFLESMLMPPGLKNFIENESRKENGKRVLATNPKVSSREVTLIFNIEGDTEKEYLANFRSFVGELQKGVVNIEVPQLGSEVYKMIYQKATSFGQNRNRTFSILTVKLEEFNPSPEGRV